MKHSITKLVDNTTMQTSYKTDDLRICEIKEVIAPIQVHDEIP
ncbi:MAG: hypothetical protein RIR18_2143, partial [Pseudomonadota bacterium]